MIDLATLGDFVARRRKELGLTQQDIAASLGYTVQAISKFETGLSQMDLATLPALASFLKLSLDDLLKQNDNPSSVPFNGTFNPEYLAHNLAFLRNKAGLTQEEAATLGGVAKRSLANYEKGSSLPPVSALAIYCREYGVSADDIVTKKLEPVVSEPTPVKKGLGLGFKIALMAAALLTVAGVTVGATSPLWAKKDSDSGTSGEETANNISSEGATGENTGNGTAASISNTNATDGTGANATSYSGSEDLSNLSFFGRVNGSKTATLQPGTYSLSVSFTPSDWYDDTKYSRVKWRVSETGSTDASGAEVQYITTAKTWQLAVKDSATDGGILVLQPYVESLEGELHNVYSSSYVNITFSNPATTYTTPSTDFIADLKSFSPNINGYSELWLAPGSYKIEFTFDPKGWQTTNAGNFGIGEQDPSSSNYIRILGTENAVEKELVIDEGANEKDTFKTWFYVMDAHDPTNSLVSTGFLLIHGSTT